MSYQDEAVYGGLIDKYYIMKIILFCIMLFILFYIL